MPTTRSSIHVYDEDEPIVTFNGVDGADPTDLCIEWDEHPQSVIFISATGLRRLKAAIDEFLEGQEGGGA